MLSLCRQLAAKSPYIWCTDRRPSKFMSSKNYLTPQADMRDGLLWNMLQQPDFPVLYCSAVRDPETFHPLSNPGHVIHQA